MVGKSVGVEARRPGRKLRQMFDGIKYHKCAVWLACTKHKCGVWGQKVEHYIGWLHLLKCLD